MSVGFLILTTLPNENILIFTTQLDATKIKSYIICDYPIFGTDDFQSLGKYRYISDKICRENGYSNLNYLVQKKKGSDVTAWDKALFLLNSDEELKKLDFVWIVEDDVFIPSVQSIVNMTQKYFTKLDLVVKENTSFDTKCKEKWSHCREKPKNFKANEIFFSMVCAIGISRKFLNIISSYTIKHKKLFFLELFFNTLAHNYKLNIKLAPELNPIVYQYKAYNNYNWDFASILKILYKYNNTWFHPVKNFSLQNEYRNILDKSFKFDYTFISKKYAGDISKIALPKNYICPNVKILSSRDPKNIIDFVLNSIDNIITAENGENIRCNKRSNFLEELSEKGYDEDTVLNRISNRNYSFFNLNTETKTLDSYTIENYLILKK